MFARIATRSAALKAPRSMAVRGFSVAAIQQKDVISDLYIKELKAYKPAPASKADEAQVKDLKLPPAPAAPQVDEDLAAQLAAYDAEPEEASQ
ncbi:ATP synthase complex subunit H-domain-containing protein [Halteromyces radiatus]|uniref:ATP synthase complex subunit H-domain-containing protein n=1 Tax=Halteromyces radiatus TaxID=101107 RepID=UPI00221FC587|nr:ATP synthase complex subunit H-domain-containing protein [Halteromyces radiatus]KAI8092921.1 ATP synthase complex subunit H-domain-containing protein [Halteromyces radiatus]